MASTSTAAPAIEAKSTAASPPAGGTGAIAPPTSGPVAQAAQGASAGIRVATASAPTPGDAHAPSASTPTANGVVAASAAASEGAQAAPAAAGPAAAAQVKDAPVALAAGQPRDMTSPLQSTQGRAAASSTLGVGVSGPAQAPVGAQTQGGASGGAHGGQGRPGLFAAASSAGGLGAPQALGSQATAQPAAEQASPVHASAFSSTPDAGPLPGSGVGMQEMIDTIRATVDLAARQGLTQARIALQPAELGQIRIHLSQSAEGLVARVTADTPAAAQALAQGRSELHQSLSSLGLSLRLDIGSSGQFQAGERDDRSAGGSAGSGASTPSIPSDDGEGADTLGGSGTAQGHPVLAGGGLVDVLA